MPILFIIAIISSLWMKDPQPIILFITVYLAYFMYTEFIVGNFIREILVILFTFMLFKVPAILFIGIFVGIVYRVTHSGEQS